MFFVETPCYSARAPPAEGHPSLRPSAVDGGGPPDRDDVGPYAHAELPPSGNLPDAAPAGLVHAGTRLTVTAKVGMPGHEFTIRTPGTPQRWAALEEELAWHWAALGAEMARPPSQRDALVAVRHAMALYYFTVNMGPLTRGSSAVALVLLAGASLAAGLPLSLPMTEGVQLDWEGILSPTLDIFLSRTLPLTHTSLWQRARGGSPLVGTEYTTQGPTPTCAGPLDVSTLPSIPTLFPTTRSVLAGVTQGAEGAEQ